MQASSPLAVLATLHFGGQHSKRQRYIERQILPRLAVSVRSMPVTANSGPRPHEKAYPVSKNVTVAILEHFLARSGGRLLLRKRRS
jgi:hypothetical protein